MGHVLSQTSTFDQIMVKHPNGKDEIILVKTGPTVQAYRNRCPHVGVGLDYGDGRCLAKPNVLECALHGARFYADTGMCFDGPCQGDALERLPITIVDGRVEIAD